MRLRLVLPVVALGLAAAAAAAALALRPGGEAPPAGAARAAATVAEHPTPIPEETRTVLVSAERPSPSPAPRLLRAGLEVGAMPADRTLATVVTDTDCAPDAFGVSYCRNELELDGGGTIVLRHPHRMADVPCLAPGERVVLRRA